MLRVSERKAFRNCPQAWWWQYREGLVPKGAPASQLWFGTGIHYALAEWYDIGFARGVEPVKTFTSWVGKERQEYIQTGRNEFGLPEFEDAWTLGISMLNHYRAQYGKDDELETLAIEQPFEIDVVDERGDYVCTVAGTFDGVLRDHVDGNIYLWEHKTAQQISTAYLSLDDQAGTYYAVASQVLRAHKILSPRDRIHGILYNFLRKAKPDERPRNSDGFYLNSDGTVSKRQPPALFHREIIERNAGEVNRQLARLRDDALWMKAVRDGKAPILKNTTFMCNRCRFFEMCQLDEKGNKRAVEVMKKRMYTVQDPYWDHRKSAAELCTVMYQSERSSHRHGTPYVLYVQRQKHSLHMTDCTKT